MKSGKTLLFVVASFLLWSSNARASITYTSWHLSVGTDVTGSAFTQVVSPFMNSHAATNGISSASAQYNIVYDSLSADIQATTQLSLQGGTSLSDFSFGRLRFFTDQPVYVTVDSFFTYALPSGDRRVRFTTLVAQSSPVVTLYFSGGGAAAPVFGDPSSGTFMESTNGVLLPANGNYELNYSMRFDSLGGNSTQLSQGNGMYHVTLQTVPEPSTAALLSTGVLLRCRRHKRR